MSAYLELARDGKLGPAGAQMLYDVVASVQYFDRLRPFDGSEAWTSDTTMELAHDFLSDERTPKRLASLMLRATDDSSLQRLLEQAVRNYVRDRLRQTDHGAFRRKLRTVLGEDDRVEVRNRPPGEAWALPDMPDSEPWTGDPADFDAAAWTVDAPVIRWRSEARRSPAADREALVRVTIAAIEAADKPLLTTTLTEVGLRRFALANSPVFVELDEDPASTASDVAGQVAADDRALEVFEQLTADELTILAHWELPMRGLAALLDLGKSVTSVRVKRLETRLGQLLGLMDDGAEVWEDLMRLTHAWWEERTAMSGLSFDETDRSI